jgi:hypothetical protein
LAAAAEKGRAVLAGTDRRSGLPAALDALLRAPVLTPKVLAALAQANATEISLSLCA